MRVVYGVSFHIPLSSSVKRVRQLKYYYGHSGCLEIKHLAMLLALSQIYFCRLSDVKCKDFKNVQRYYQTMKCQDSIGETNITFGSTWCSPIKCKHCISSIKGNTNNFNECLRAGLYVLYTCGHSHCMQKLLLLTHSCRWWIVYFSENKKNTARWTIYRLHLGKIFLVFLIWASSSQFCLNIRLILIICYKHINLSEDCTLLWGPPLWHPFHCI